MRQLINLLRNNARKGEFRAEGNTLYLYDVIVSSKADAEWLGGVDAETFVQTLRDMSGDVTVRVNSPGGDVFAGRAMAQAIRDYPGDVTVHVDGYAASAASFVTAAADKVVMGQGSFQMIHNAWTIALGNAEELLATADLLEKIDATIVETYVSAADRRGKAVDGAKFAELMAAETWLTGQESIDLGLADELASDAPKGKIAWDMSAYNTAPEATTEQPKVEAADIDLPGFAALAEALAALTVQPKIEAEPIIEPAEEIEQMKPNYAADMLLRPAP